MNSNLNWSGRRTLCMTFFSAMICLSFLYSPAVANDLSDEQKTELARIKSLVDRGGKYYKSGDFKKSAVKIRDAQKRLIKLAGIKNPEIVSRLKSDYTRIENAQKLLRKKDESFDAMPDLDSFMPSSASKGGDESEPGEEFNPFESDANLSSDEEPKDSDADDMNANEGDGSESEKTELVSFTKEVAPIVMEHCGKCHVNQNKGTYSAATYDSLKKGTKKKGIAVKPGNIEKSRMISLIEDGEMPPKSASFPAEQLATLKTWIEQGAKFDGENKKETLAEMVGEDDASSGQRSGPPRRGGRDPGQFGG